MRGDKEAKSPPGTQRKLLKPQVERRRRERINRCLEKLRVLLSEAMKNEQKLKNPKMEKAEILEYTVEFIQSKMTSSKRSHDNLEFTAYQSGFQQCLQNTEKFITRTHHLSPSSMDFFFRQLSSMNLSRLSTRALQSSAHLHRVGHPDSTETSEWLHEHNGSPDVNNVNIQSDWHPGHMCRSWRPWM